MTATYPSPARRNAIVASTMLATVMTILDTSIANIALPQIQSSLSASSEQAIWIITSYVIAGAIGTQLCAWLATRFGRKRIMLLTVTGFTLSSLACGLATNLESLVLFRFIQGLAGASMAPLSQATILDIYPREQHGKAMALYGMGSMIGGVMGPTLGGLMTEWWSWRVIFLVNVPMGIIAMLGMAFSINEAKSDKPARFDTMGFIALSVFLASFQLMLDRGQQLDWFESPEIWVEAIVAATAFYVFIVHMFTFRDPYVKPAIFADRNFALGSMVSTAMGVLVFGSLPLISIMIQVLLGYPVLASALVGLPRGLGNMVGMLTVSWLISKIDNRLLIIAGIAAMAWSFYAMAGMTIEMGDELILSTGMVLGIGFGLIFIPLSTFVFATLDPSLRNEGAAFFALSRNIGTAAGVSILQLLLTRNAAAVEARLVEGVRPDNPVVQMQMPGLDLSNPLSVAGLHGQIARQSLMVSYIDAYWLLFLVSLCLIPLILVMRAPKAQTAAPIAIAVD